jgi:hypothetical protein
MCNDFAADVYTLIFIFTHILISTPLSVSLSISYTHDITKPLHTLITHTKSHTNRVSEDYNTKTEPRCHYHPTMIHLQIQNTHLAS